MKIFKELSKIGYKHYTEYTVEELDDLPLNFEERTIEQALVLRWFRKKHDLEGVIEQANDYTWYKFSIYQKSNFYTSEGWKVLKSKGLEYITYEETELACLIKLITIVNK